MPGKTQKELAWLKGFALLDPRIVYDEKLDLIINLPDALPFTGQLTYSIKNNVVWVYNGKIHHPVKPAVQLAHVNTYTIDRIEYWLDGIEYTFEEFWEKQKDTVYAPQIMAIRLGEKT